MNCMKATVLIIGAGSDIGAAIAERFAREGHPLLLAARNSSRLLPQKADLEIRYNIPCSLLEMDITETGKLAGIWNQLPEKPGITISVVGYMNDNEKVFRDGVETERTIVTNYLGPAVLLNAVAEEYIKAGQGTIAGISSVAGLRGRQSNFIYGSAKAGFIAYLSGLRNRLYPHGVHVMTVLPGFVYTKMTAHLTLPGLLTAQPAAVADAVYKGIQKKKNILYVKWFWKWIMCIIRMIPEGIFKKKKL